MKIRAIADKDGRLSWDGVYPGAFGKYRIDIAQGHVYVDKSGRIRERIIYDDAFYVLENGRVIDVLTAAQVKIHKDYRGK